MHTRATKHRTLERAGGAFAALTVYFVLMFTGLTTLDLVENAAGAYANAGEPAAMALVALDGAYRTDGTHPGAGADALALLATNELPLAAWSTSGGVFASGPFTLLARTPVSDATVQSL